MPGQKKKGHCVHGQEDDTARDDGGVVHRVLRYGQNRGQREDHGDEQRPDDAVEVHRPPEPPIAEVERSGLEPHLRVMLEYPAEGDRDDVRDVERHRGEREYGVRRDRRSKVEQAGEDAEDGREPDRTQGGMGPLGDVAKVALVRETCRAFGFVEYARGSDGRWGECMHTFVTAKGIDGPRARLKGSLTDEERCETNKRL